MSISYFNRYTQRIEEETAPQEKWLRWLYHDRMGRSLLHVFFKRGIFSKGVGWWMNRPVSKKKIRTFAQKYAINWDDFEKTPDDYVHFNDFFCRRFKPGVRTFNSNEKKICFPAEGRHLGFESVEGCTRFFLKGESLNLFQLLGSEEKSRLFEKGTMVISRLCPADYHRFHFPFSGIPSTPKCINGSLYSVHPLALNKNLKFFVQNKRWVTFLESDLLGEIALVEIGATCVGSVKQIFRPQQRVQKGDEKGYFLFGGSTVITLFQKNLVSLCDDLLFQTKAGYELFAHCGDTMASCV